MKQTFFFVTLSFLIVFLVSGCNDIGLNEEKEAPPEQVKESLTFTRITDFQADNSSKATTEKSEEKRYYCTVSTLAKKSFGKNYIYESFYIDIPKNLNKGKPIVFKRIITSERAKNIEYAGSYMGRDNVIRVARCMIPDNDQVYDLVQEFLSKYGKHSWLADVVDEMKAKGITP